jgi:hypothetical protein
MSGTLDEIQRIEVFFEPRESDVDHMDNHGLHALERKLIDSVEIKQDAGWDIGKPRLPPDGSLQIVAIREEQVKEWYFARDKWDRYEIAATRKVKKDES